MANIINFRKDYPDALIVKLEQNYRSTKNIIAWANGVIAKNTSGIKKELWTDNLEGENVIKTKEFDYVKANFGNIKVNSPMFVNIVANHFYSNLDEILFNSMGLTKKVNKLYDTIKKLEEYLEKMDKNIYDIKKEKNVGCFKRLFKKCFC